MLILILVLNVLGIAMSLAFVRLKALRGDETWREKTRWNQVCVV